MKSIIITIGDELLIGQVVNTNASFIARHLNSAGIEVLRVVTVGDEGADILSATRESIASADIVILTGGLGPTHDDITKDVLCELFGTRLEVNEEARAGVSAFLAKRNVPWSGASEHQILFPRGATLIPNPNGTASGILFEQRGHICIALPGVPYEMEEMITGWVVPYLASRTGGKAVLHRTLRTTGIAESRLAERIGPVSAFLGSSKLAFLPSPGGVRLRISVVRADRESAMREIDRIERWIRSRAAEYIYGMDDDELPAVIGSLLKASGFNIAIAESCTGGLVADAITDIPGSSEYFERGIIAYSNRSKTELLGVPPALIELHGAVSGEVAAAMADGIRARSGAEIGLSTTGIAGPTGGTREKPEGSVWIGYADRDGTFALRYFFGAGRRRVKERAVSAALDLLRRKLQKLPLPDVDTTNIYRI